MKFLEINATDINNGIIAHGVNRQLAMGAGIAGALCKKWPQVREQYLTRTNPIPPLGSVDMVYIHGKAGNMITGPLLFVANCYTQNFYGPGDKKYADPDAIFEAANKLLALANCYDLPVYIPKIGCGLGGLDWESEVKPALLDAEQYLKSMVVGQPEEHFYVTEFTVIDLPQLRAAA
jgi:O-acetyl-ADP-ribose deacetylase (regulator of RNase III)